MVVVDIHLQLKEHWVDQITQQVLQVQEQMDHFVFDTATVGSGTTSFFYQCTSSKCDVWTNNR